MRVELQFGGISAGVSGLSQIAGGYRQVSRWQDRVNSTLPKFKAPTSGQIQRVSEYASALRDVARAQADLSRSGQGLDFKTPAARRGALPGGVAQSAPLSPRTTFAKGSGVVRFIKGPNQRLAEIAEQRASLSSIADEQQRGRIGADLDRAERSARRSITLDQRRRDNPELMESPGLLETLSGVARQLDAIGRSRNAGQVLRNIGLGVKFLQEQRGGLNAQQRMARTFNAGAPIGGLARFNPNTRGQFSASSLAIGHARIAQERMQRPGVSGSAPNNSPVSGGGGSSSLLQTLGQMHIALAIAALMIEGTLKLASFAIKSFTEAAVAGAKRMQGVADASRLSGGSLGQVAGLQALGISADQIPGMAASFRQHTGVGTGDVYGQIGRARLGLQPVLGGPLGPTNEAEDLTRAIEGLRKITNPNERLRVARMTGTTDLLGIAGTSGGVFSSLQKDMSAQGKVFGNKQYAQDATDLQAQFGRVFSNAFAGLTALVQPLLRPVANFFGSIADALRNALPSLERFAPITAGVGKIVEQAGRLIGGAINTIAKGMNTKEFGQLAEMVGQGLGKIAEGLPFLVKGIGFTLYWIGKAISILPGVGPIGTAMSGFGKFLDAAVNNMDAVMKDSAISEHTKAMRAHTRALEHAPGTYGGGPRARAALGPSVMRDLNSPAAVELRSRAIREQALMLGYWTI